MSGIAEILLNLGYKVSGSDISFSDKVKYLQSKGATIYIGHSRNNIKDDYDVVIYSTAIRKDNIELITAKQKRIPTIHRGEMLSELLRLKQYSIAVAGTHGKTTTTSMLSHILSYSGLNPTCIIGGKLLNFGTNAILGKGEYLVCEADESDGSFLKLKPTISVITSIDTDHLDHYKSFENLKKAFIEFANAVPFYGFVSIFIDDPTIREIYPNIGKKVIKYGFSESSDIMGKINNHLPLKIDFSVYKNRKKLSEITLRMLGIHNVYNALASISVSLEIGISIEDIKSALYEFKGVSRRLELIYEGKDVLLFDDYGHHPTEIKNTIRALKIFGRRIIVVFQPHRYTRTKELYEDFGLAFTSADEVIVLDIYPAGEEKIEGISGKLIYDAIKKHNYCKVHYVEEKSKIVEYLLPLLQKGDIILTLGAGDITKIAREIKDAISSYKKIK